MLINFWYQSSDCMFVGFWFWLVGCFFYSNIAIMAFFAENCNLSNKRNDLRILGYYFKVIYVFQ